MRTKVEEGKKEKRKNETKYAFMLVAKLKAGLLCAQEK
jgi:hypothetical protein